MNISNINNCCGCGACRQICPKNCIIKVNDNEGFIKMQITTNECINCGLCIKVCPMSGRGQFLKNAYEKKVYAAVAKDEMIYQSSSSGGAFSIFADFVFSKNGIVFGCGYDKKLCVRHLAIKNREELDRIRRSKYVQSDTGDTYLEVKKYLEKGKYVLYSGTPCQIAGLRGYLGKDYENLLLIDIICHGVPSPQMFGSNLEYIAKKKRKKLINYEFRLKETKGKSNTFFVAYIYDNNIIEYKSYYHDAYFNSFYNMESLNECCYECRYANGIRQGDITLGDFGWAKKWHDEFKEYDDISCIIVNTYKGEDILEKVKNDFIICCSQFDYVLQNNKNLIRPTERPQYRNEIYKFIENNGYEKWADKYFYSMKYIKKLKVIRRMINIKNNILLRKRGIKY